MSNLIFDMFTLDESNNVIDIYTKDTITTPITINDEGDRTTYSVGLLRDLLLLHREVEEETN